MIIDYSINSKSYQEKILDFYGIWNWECPTCHSKRTFHRHGTYNRNLLTINNNCLTEDYLEILRLKCSSCRHTHAILPFDVIPFYSYATTCIIALCVKVYQEEKSILFIGHDIKISYQLIYKFLAIFQVFLNRIKHLLRQLEVFRYSQQISCQEILLYLTSFQSLSKFMMYYLNYYRSPLFLTRRCTSSYPFTIGCWIF